MNKIQIQDLLNSPRDVDTKQELRDINDKLFALCSKLPSSEALLEAEFHLELRDIMLNLSKLQDTSRMGSEEKHLAYTAHQLTCTMITLIKGMKNFHGTGGHSYSSSKSESDDKTVFNVVTQDMMNLNRTGISYRGHRFSKENVKVLERWYTAHIDRPYLNRQSTEYLISKTGLSRVQIKNWVSNRRRKEKSVHVSPELIQLLQKKS
ncbi:hypothetical protein KAFR_0D00720 [Kazachstania africana CBS 2517]|uniref:Homeobox domain-containing protein n=1 Tax=Kazachstania africana (strain ATCC 22294 / BCRC 22015 / CBS 2517 / CECT 1963 / NBRC 1671 / NRRL Y-8276) TaxID=1071382 RepID=H2ATL9_KAZAF|nr:hypothetical protein KAFR_0D00720 [Kazachstania africana CBS 2517]CCF57719.1 hypothetical protein KAFR_0D00720 [Kazachstania africana CBS 2517]